MSKAQRELLAMILPSIEDVEDIRERRIRFMDDSGIDIQVLSCGPENPQNITDKALALGLFGEANDTLAAHIKKYPGRLSGFAILPVVDPVVASEELERSVTELDLKGAAVSGTFKGQFFDHPEFFPIFSTVHSADYPFLKDETARYFLDNASIPRKTRITLVTKMLASFCTVLKW